MALIVKVFVNERPIEEYHAVRMYGKPGQLCAYKLGDGAIIDHYYDDGVTILAAKILLHYTTSKQGHNGSR